MAPAATGAKKQKKKWSKYVKIQAKACISQTLPHTNRLLATKTRNRTRPSYHPQTTADISPLNTVKDKAQHAVLLDKTTSEKLYKDVQSYRLVTVSTLVDRLKINGSLARKCLKDLEEKGQIKPIVTHSKMKIYTRAVGASD
ncbi:ribosomal protein S25 [Xylariaceae sp. FL1651]|nr:ribosomal protein S25 [Xylariaceae sp. FL1651]